MPDLEAALKTAITCEQGIRDLYTQAATESSDAVGKRIFTLLAEDEQSHVDYLEHQLRQWQAGGRITLTDFKATPVDRERVAKELVRLSASLQGDDRGVEQQMLSKALAMEIETSGLYARLVGDFDEEAKALFERFLEIENGHVDVVQAQLDHLSQTGYWLGYKEFGLEGE